MVRRHAAVGQERSRVAALHLLDVRGDVLVRRDRHGGAVVGDGVDRGELVVAAERGVGLLAEDAEEEFGLHRLRGLAGGLELAQLPAHRVRQQPAEADEQEAFEGHDSPARDEAHSASRGL